MERRTLLKTVGGIGAASGLGIGGMAVLSGGAAASAVNIEGDNLSVSNDRGDLSEVTVDPEFTVSWDGLDDAVGKVFFLLEAKVGNGDFQPVYRATPWMDVDTIGTEGSFTRPSSNSGGLGPLVIADDDGKPDYATMDFVGTLDSYLDGTSMGSADEYPNNGVVLQNNFPEANAGYYGAASDTVPFDNDDDNAGAGTTETTEVTLRYTLELLRPNLSQLKNRMDYPVEHDGGTLEDSDDFQALDDAVAKQVAASQIDGLEESDIDAGYSAIVMNGEDGYTDFGGYSGGSGIPYNVLRNNDDDVGIIVETATVTVDVTNEGSDSGATGDSNGNAS